MHRLFTYFHLDSPELARGILRWIVQTLSFLIISGTVLFLSAWQWNWGEGWLYLTVLLIIQVCSAAVLLPTSPELLVEHSATRAWFKTWDDYLSFGVALVGPLAMWIVAGLDKRFGWSAPVDPWVIGLGLLLVLAGSLYTLWAMTANRFFETPICSQLERSQTVVASGPYAVVRHPGYLGGLVFILVTPFALGSSWTFVPAFITVALLVLRTALEDRTLIRKLPGYAAYTRWVPYRLIPGIW